MDPQPGTMAITENQRTGVWIISLVLLNLFIKDWGISAVQVGMDEPFTISAAQRTIPGIVSYLSDSNNPPLYEILLHFVVKLLGIGLPWVRLLSLLSSCVTVIYLFRTGKEFFSLFTGAVASLLFIFSTYHIYFSHEARVYAMFACFVSASSWYFLKVFHSGRTKHLLLLILCNSLLIYAHYFGIVVLLIQFGFAVLHYRHLRETKAMKLLYHFPLYLLIYIPQELIVLRRFNQASEDHWVPPPHLPDLWNSYVKFLNMPIPALVFLLILLGAAAFFLFQKERKAAYATLYLLCFFPAGYLAFFFVSFLIPVFLDRYLILFSVALFILVPVSMDYLLKGWTRTAAAAVAIILMLGTMNLEPSHRRDWKSLVELLRAETANGAYAVVAPYWHAEVLAYYLDKEIFKDYDNTPALLAARGIQCAYSVSDIDTAKLHQANKLIFVNGEESRAGNVQLREYFDSTWTQVEVLHPFEPVTVWVYEKK
jgi:uncharacterized membrane protein